jgi:hypothetical protein
MAAAMAAGCLGLFATAGRAQDTSASRERLLDWTPWERYRAAVKHPATSVHAADVARARENLRRYAWARAYRDAVEGRCRPWRDKLTPEFLERIVPETTPGATNFTPCPACRDQKRPAHPHGQWQWSVTDAERVTCAVCKTVFPNHRYPETVVLKAAYGGGQTFTYCGGEPFTLFTYKTGRPSFTGNIRAHKVLWAGTLCRDLAEAYVLTGRTEYADAARAFLLRFARVYPNWLVHTGYGEVADMDPHVAALRITSLPADELCPPPTRPDRALHTGYWTAGRATASGQEGQLIRRLAEAYDLTCEAAKDGRPVCSDAERRLIEKDLLLESTVLLVADAALNNKSVGNATATAIVGLTVGHPELIRFGVASFRKTVGEWFLPDGGTSESWSYALMTLNGIHALPQAMRGYSDPPGYADASGGRLDSLNLYQDPAYKRVWSAMFDGLQGDFRYPPLADGHRHSEVGALFAELMAVNYLEEERFRALLKAVAGEDLAKGYAPYAIYYREPGLELKAAPPLTQTDRLFPSLGIGYLREGETGRDGALVLSASDWGGHHHQDSLSLYWWRGGRELLSDLGYLWDHPQKKMTARTFAHNTVIVDGEEQATKGRGSDFTLFGGNGVAKVMEAESRAYPQADVYQRTVAQVTHGTGGVYVLDLFRVRGGKQHDYVFHGPGTDLEAGGTVDEALTGLDLKNVRRLLGGDGTARLTWRLGGGTCLTALWPREYGETAFVGDGWGQRDYKNADVGATLPYVVRRRTGGGAVISMFVGVFDSHRTGAGLVKNVRRLAVPDSERENTVAVMVEMADGGVDYVVSCREARPIIVTTPHGPLEVDGRFAVVKTSQGDDVTGAFLTGGKSLRWNGNSVARPEGNRAAVTAALRR